jgi:hypothetical protein
MRNVSAPVVYAAVLLGVLALQALLLLWPHALVINGHEGDLLHVLDGASRLAIGEWPHTGFMTPLGVLAFAPVSLFLKLGLGPGLSLRLALLLVGALVMPLTWHVGMTRLAGPVRILFGIWILVMVTGLVYGGDQATSSVSMYYNRWAWALVFLVVVMLLVPRRDGRAETRLDAALIGLMLALLALTKITCFVAIAPAVAIWFLLRRDLGGALACAGAGLAIALVTTLLAGGLGYWTAYLGDLLFVSQDSSRGKPGLDFADVIANPAFLPGTICLFLSVVVLRLFGRKDPGLLLLVLMPGFYYITYQNWGNDPTWLVVLAVVMLALRPEAGRASLFETDLRFWHNALALSALVLISPSVINVSYSTLRSAALDRSEMAPVFFRSGPDADLLISVERSFSAKGTLPLEPILQPDGTAGEPAEALDFAGEEFVDCSAQAGLIGMYQQMARDMEAKGLSDRRVLVADVVNPLWLFGSGARLPGLAPWYYGGPRGLDQAEFLVVPRCPYKTDSRKAMTGEIEGSGREARLEASEPHYLLFSLSAP